LIAITSFHCFNSGDAVEIGQVKRHQRRSTAVFSDLVVEFFQACLGSRQRHHMRTGLCQCARGGKADAARGAGHESDAGGEGKGHGNDSGATHTVSYAGLTRVSIYFVRAFRRGWIAGS